ncbi:MAG: type 4 pilus major pilin [Alphaproteobacteria bacterium]|nr:type 4 pilus major pilin [Alphaproteobacteria bacterium]
MLIQKLSLSRAQPHKTSSSKGFTLTEIAIVLGIIGLILGAIWVAASKVYANQKVGKATTQMINVVQGIRSLYSTSSVTGLADTTDMTFAICSASVFPSDTIPSTGCGTSAAPATISNPWNGATTIASTSVAVAATGDAFMIKMAGVPTTGCTALMTSLGGIGRDPGLIYLGVPAYAVASATAFPVTLATATAAAQCTSAATVTLSAVFKLKG